MVSSIEEFWVFASRTSDDLSKHRESTGRTRAAPGRRFVTGVGRLNAGMYS
jgi:hypothetical protein